VRVPGQGGQIFDGVRQQRSRRHEADKERRAIAGQLARHDEPDAQDVVAEERDARRPAGRGLEPELARHGRRRTGSDDPEEGLDERFGRLPPVLPFLVVRARLASTLLPEGDVLCQAGTKLLGVGRMAIDLDEAEDGREPPQQAEPSTLGVARRVWLVAEVGVLGLRGDLVAGNGGAGRAEGLPADLLGEMVKAIAHGARTVPRARDAAQQTDHRAPLPPAEAAPRH